MYNNLLMTMVECFAFCHTVSFICRLLKKWLNGTLWKHNIPIPGEMFNTCKKKGEVRKIASHLSDRDRENQTWNDNRYIFDIKFVV